MKYNIEDLKIGMSASYTHVITDSDVFAFANLSGDKNPIHLNDEYASKSRYKRRIAHGLFSASFFSKLFGTELPGEGCVYVSQNLKFKRPVYIGDEVLVQVIIKNIDMKNRKIFFTTQCLVNNKIVIDGEAEIFIP